MPGSRLEIFEEAGHFPHHTDPDRFVAVLSEFLTETASARFDADRWRRRLSKGRHYEPDTARAADSELHAIGHTGAN
jgi:hypothetical protein